MNVNCNLKTNTFGNTHTKSMYIFKFYFIDYAIIVVPIFPPFSLPSQWYIPHSLWQSPPHCSCPWVMCIILWLLHFLYCTSHPHGYSVTTYLYFLIPSPPRPFPYTPLPSGNYQNPLCIHDSVSVLVCLVCFCFFIFNYW